MAIFDLLMLLKSMLTADDKYTTQEMLCELETELFTWGVFEILGAAWRHIKYDLKPLAIMVYNAVKVAQEFNRQARDALKAIKALNPQACHGKLITMPLHKYQLIMAALHMNRRIIDDETSGVREDPFQLQLKTNLTDEKLFGDQLPRVAVPRDKGADKVIHDFEPYDEACFTDKAPNVHSTVASSKPPLVRGADNERRSEERPPSIRIGISEVYAHRITPTRSYCFAWTARLLNELGGQYEATYEELAIDPVSRFKLLRYQEPFLQNLYGEKVICGSRQS